MIRKKMFVLSLGLALAGGNQLARATDVFRLEGFGAVSRSMGGTAVAHDVGPAGMMTNPATLSLMPEGDQVMLGLDLVTTDIGVRNRATSGSVSSEAQSNNRGPYVAPEAAYTRHVGPWAFGVGAFAQGGLGTEYGNGSFLSRATGGLATGLDNSSRLLMLNIPFAASFQANDRVTIGGSIDVIWEGLNLDMLLRADQLGSLIGAGRVSGSLVGALGGLPDLRGAHFSLTKDRMLASGVDSWGYGGKLGMIYRAAPETTLGASYTFRSQMNDMEGRATLTAIDGAAGQIAFDGKIWIKDFQMPAHLDLGISHRLTPQWTLAADVSRVFWKDVMMDIKVSFVADAGGDINILMPQNYKDQTILSLGAAYEVNDRWTVRGGLRLASQALSSSTLFAVIPAIPTKHLSAGFTYSLSKRSKLDFAYSHAFEETMKNGSLPNTSDPIEVSHSQDNATVNFRYSF